MGETIQLQRLPDGFIERGASVTRLEAFAASFAQIMIFWSAHTTWSWRF